jgi:DNA repair protein RadD
MDLRPYQEAALDALYASIEDGITKPLLALPTGSGKSLVMAQGMVDFAAQGARVLNLAHVTELIEQNASAVHTLGSYAGIHAAKLKSRDLVSPIVCASIQSAAAYLAKNGYLPARDIVFVDEAHRIGRSASSQYAQVLAALNPKLVIGLTATPYRLDSGRLDRGEDALFEKVVYDLPMSDLVDEGFLSPLRAAKTSVEIDMSSVHTRAGEFIASEMETAAMAVLVGMTDDILERTTDRRCTIVFAAGIKSAEAMASLIRASGRSATLLTGKMGDGERARVVRDVKAGAVRYVVNVQVATTGFDAPNIDCVVLARGTKSTSLYVQMLGRGTRLAPGKADCLVLDYGGNIDRLGPPDAPHDVGADYEKEDETPPGEAIEKLCPACDGLVHASARVCPHEGCGFWFPQRYEACKQEGFLLRGGKQWLDVAGWAWQAAEDTLRLVYEVCRDEQRMEVNETVVFDGTTTPPRWQQLGGVSKTAAAAEAEAESMYPPIAVLLVKDGEEIAVRSAAQREQRRRRK